MISDDPNHNFGAENKRVGRETKGERGGRSNPDTLKDFLGKHKRERDKIKKQVSWDVKTSEREKRTGT